MKNATAPSDASFETTGHSLPAPSRHMTYLS